MRNEVVKHTSKVIAYLTWQKKLLVFEHPLSPEAGIQVPAGTIEPHEAPADAVARELREETGLDNFIVDKLLANYDYDMSQYRPEIQNRYVFHIKLLKKPLKKWRHYETDGGRNVPGIPFDFYWVDIDSDLALIAGQGDYLPTLRKLMIEVD